MYQEKGKKRAGFVLLRERKKKKRGRFGSVFRKERRGEKRKPRTHIIPSLPERVTSVTSLKEVGQKDRVRSGERGSQEAAHVEGGGLFNCSFWREKKRGAQSSAVIRQTKKKEKNITIFAKCSFFLQEEGGKLLKK